MSKCNCDCHKTEIRASLTADDPLLRVIEKYLLLGLMAAGCLAGLMLAFGLAIDATEWLSPFFVGWFS